MAHRRDCRIALDDACVCRRRDARFHRKHRQLRRTGISRHSGWLHRAGNAYLSAACRLREWRSLRGRCLVTAAGGIRAGKSRDKWLARTPSRCASNDVDDRRSAVVSGSLAPPGRGRMLERLCRCSDPAVPCAARYRAGAGDRRPARRWHRDAGEFSLCASRLCRHATRIHQQRLAFRDCCNGARFSLGAARLLIGGSSRSRASRSNICGGAPLCCARSGAGDRDDTVPVAPLAPAGFQPLQHDLDHSGCLSIPISAARLAAGDQCAPADRSKPRRGSPDERRKVHAPSGDGDSSAGSAFRPRGGRARLPQRL